MFSGLQVQDTVPAIHLAVKFWAQIVLQTVYSSFVLFFSVLQLCQ